MVILSTLRMNLSPCRVSDAADFIALERDPEVMRFLNGGRLPDTDQPDPHADYLMPRGSEPHVWTARNKADDAFIGWFCLWPENPATTAELGYRLRRAEWGKGLAVEGGAALMKWGFSRQGYARITATTMAANLASRRVMEKLGMTLNRTEPYSGPDPIRGSELGEVWYEIARGEH